MPPPASAALFDLGNERSGPLAWPLEPRLLFDGAGAATLEVAYVDAAHVADLSRLASLVRPGVEVVRVAGDRDGWRAMAEDLQGRSGLTAVHVVGHGAAGKMTLGNASLDANGLEAHKDDLTAIGQALTGEGDLLLYGCDTGRGEAGRILVDNLARLTGADVAASTDPTGSARLGGNWTLERTSGAVEAAPLLVNGEGYDHLLTTFDFTGETVPGGSSSKTFTVSGNNLNTAINSGGSISITQDGTAAPMAGDYLKFTVTTPGSTITLSADSGMNFSVTSFDLFNEGGAGDFTLTPTSGTGGSPSVVNKSLALWSGTSLTTDLATWSGLTKFTILSDKSFGIDNLVVTFSVADTTAPRISSIDRQTPATASTDADSLVWRVTFNETVSNVSTGDFSVSGSTATATNVASAGGNAYDVTVSGGNLASLNATVTLAISGAQDITDSAGNALVEQVKRCNGEIHAAVG
ncbi:MAG: DUF4347 domain-containing protein, partial [Magnetococcales bacterium]|nr:DUF4347 domain-containing protein [Magnetococcales bacterium]